MFMRCREAGSGLWSKGLEACVGVGGDLATAADFGQKAAQQIILLHLQISYGRSGYRLGDLAPFVVRSWNEL